MMTTPDANLTLSIVSHGHGLMLARLLDDLSQLPSVTRAKIVVTLNSADDSLDVAPWPTLNIQLTRNSTPRGFGANHNAAFRTHCSTDWFAVLNPDLRLPTDPFPALFKVATECSQLGVIAPRIVGPGGDREDSVRANLTPWSLIRRHWRRAAIDKVMPACDRTHDRTQKHPASFYWLAGMFMMFPAAAFQQVGGFDERFFLYCEDYDICARLWGAGRDLAVAEDALAVHDAQRTSRRSLMYLKWHLTSLLRVWTSSAFWRVTARARGVSTVV